MWGAAVKIPLVIKAQVFFKPRHCLSVCKKHARQVPPCKSEESEVIIVGCKSSNNVSVLLFTFLYFYFIFLFEAWSWNSDDERL